MHSMGGVDDWGTVQILLNPTEHSDPRRIITYFIVFESYIVWKYACWDAADICCDLIRKIAQCTSFLSKGLLCDMLVMIKAP